MNQRVGFIGFGEVASRFAPAIRARGVAVAAYDLIEAKSAAAGFPALPLRELLEESTVVFSTVTSQSAVAAAEACLPHLHKDHTYVDLNSTAPPVKVRIAAIVAQSGAEFVEGAILGAVGVSGAATRILTGGPAGDRAAALLRDLGLNAAFYDAELGKASMFKMLRSIFSKGLEALILELLVAGRRAGIEGSLWADVCDFMTKNPFDRVAANWIETHPAACERRYHEMAQVRETLRDIGVPPLMTLATEAFFDRSRSSGLPDSGEDAVTFIERRMR